MGLWEQLPGPPDPPKPRWSGLAWSGVMLATSLGAAYFGHWWEAAAWFVAASNSVDTWRAIGKGRKFEWAYRRMEAISTGQGIGWKEAIEARTAAELDLATARARVAELETLCSMSGILGSVANDPR